MEDRRNFSRLYNQMTLQDLNQVAPGVSPLLNNLSLNVNTTNIISWNLSNKQIPWRRLVDAVFLDKIPDREVFIVKVPSVLNKIDQLLAETDSR